jgi:putative hydrolase of the HAD superfamily
MKRLALSADVECIFFDAGGTLLHPHPSVGEIYARTARRHGLRVSAARMNAAFRSAWARCHQSDPTRQTSPATAVAWWRHVVFSTLEALGAQMADREAYFQELYETFARPDVWRLFPETRATLDALAQRGYKLGLISNWDARLRPLLAELDIARYFHVSVISCEVGAEKPDAAIFQHALRCARVRPAAALHIGDSPREDVRGARAVGMRALLLERDHKTSVHAASIRALSELL